MLKTFIIFSILGSIYELLITKRIHYDTITNKLFGLNIPILPLYGTAGIILTLINDNIKDMPYKLLLAFILINLLECISGQLSLRFNGYQTWKYDGMTICNNYVSLLTAIWWTLLSYIIFMFL